MAALARYPDLRVGQSEQVFSALSGQGFAAALDRGLVLARWKSARPYATRWWRFGNLPAAASRSWWPMCRHSLPARDLSRQQPRYVPCRTPARNNNVAGQLHARKSVDRAIAAGHIDLRFTPNTQLQQDLQTMQSLSPADAATYFQAHPSLWPIWCSCTSGKLGETSVNPDGTFSFCYDQYLLPILNCFHSYFYKVKQLQGGVFVYIYDGSAANQYFNADEVANLSTFLGNSCGSVTPPPPGTDFVTLQQIGSTLAYQLHSNYGGTGPAPAFIDKTQTGPYSVAAPPALGGLVNFGGFNDAPWCKTLGFILYFDPGMEALGAKYYRMSFAPADTNGNPVGSMQTILNPIAWSKFVVTVVGGATQVDIEPQTLGPNTVGSTTGLFQIPYNADADWLNGQAHQYFDTTTLNPAASGIPGPGNGRFLLALEIFDSSGNRLVPTGVAAGTGDNQLRSHSCVSSPPPDQGVPRMCNKQRSRICSGRTTDPWWRRSIALHSTRAAAALRVPMSASS